MPIRCRVSGGRRSRRSRAVTTTVGRRGRCDRREWRSSRRRRRRPRRGAPAWRGRAVPPRRRGDGAARYLRERRSGWRRPRRLRRRRARACSRSSWSVGASTRSAHGPSGAGWSRRGSDVVGRRTDDSSTATNRLAKLSPASTKLLSIGSAPCSAAQQAWDRSTKPWSRSRSFESTSERVRKW